MMMKEEWNVSMGEKGRHKNQESRGRLEVGGGEEIMNFEINRKNKVNFDDGDFT